MFSNGVRALHARVFTPTVCVHCTQTWSMFQKRCSTSTDIAISKSKKESYFTNSTISSGFRIGMPLECSPAAPGAQRRAHAMMIDALSTVTDFVPEMMFRWFPRVCPTHERPEKDSQAQASDVQRQRMRAPGPGAAARVAADKYSKLTE